LNPDRGKRFGFVDKDGDGINDRIQDADGDGIPNCQDPDWSDRKMGQATSSVKKLATVRDKKVLALKVRDRMLEMALVYVTEPAPKEWFDRINLQSNQMNY